MKLTGDQTRHARAFAREVDALWMGALNGTFREFARRLRAMERKYLAALKNDAVSTLEVRRRVAENILEASIFHKCTLRFCMEKLNENFRLGFSNRWREVHFRLRYAEASLLRGSSKTAIRMVCEVADLISDLERTNRKYDKMQAETYRVWVARIDAAIEERGRRAPRS